MLIITHVLVENENASKAPCTLFRRNSGGFTLKTNQMFFVHAMQKEFKTQLSAPRDHDLFPVIDLSLRKTQLNKMIRGIELSYSIEKCWQNLAFARIVCKNYTSARLLVLADFLATACMLGFSIKCARFPYAWEDCPACFLVYLTFHWNWRT